MPKMRKQIISPHVRFAASSRGPYANKLGGGMYAKSFNLGCFEYYFVSGDRIELPVTLGGTSPGRIEVTARPDSLDTSTNRLIIEGDGGTAQNSFRIWWFAAPTGRYMFRAFSGDNIVNPYVEQSINNPQELKFVGRWKATSGGGQFDITDQDNVTYTQTGVSGTSSPIPHNKIIVGINRSLQANSQWVGVIRDIKLYDAEFNGNLVHWWKVDDNATGTGAIKDSVGDADGDLIQGSGAWRACTSWQRPADDADFKAFGEDSAGVINALVRGQGAVTFERQTTATVETGPDGLIEECLEHEIRHKKGRRNHNLIPSDPWATINANLDFLGGSTYELSNLTTGNSRRIELSDDIYSGVDLGGRQFRVRFAIKGEGSDIGKDIRVQVRHGSGTSTVVTLTITLTADYVTYSPNLWTGNSGSLGLQVWMFGDVSNNADACKFKEVQIEEVTGQANQNPSEYVSVGVGTGSEELPSDYLTNPGAWDSVHPSVTFPGSYIDFNASPSGFILLQIQDTLVANKTYVVTVDSEHTAGGFEIQAGSSAADTPDISTTGIHTYSVKADSNQNITVVGRSTFTGKINSISIKDADHGAFVDGVRYYAKTNPCQVDGNNVVTEDAATTPITDYRTLFEPASTNYTDDSNDLSGGAETVDLSAGGTGDFTLSVSGTAAVTVAAGTATGTGFGQATAGNPVTFNLTSTGTVTLTLDSGSLDTAQGGQAVKQVEPGSTATSFIITDGSPPVTRTADDPAPFADISNFDLTKGTFVWDLTMAAAVDQGIIGFANAQAGVCSYNASAGRFETTDGTNTAFVDPSLASNLGDIIRFAVLYSTDNGLRIGYRNVTDAGPWVWDTNSAAFDGAFTSNDVFNATFGLATPTTFKYLEYYSVDKTKQWVEDNK